MGTKLKLGVLSMLVMSSFAQANVRTLASVTTSGGFMPPQFQGANGIVIYEDGLVKEIRRGVPAAALAKLSLNRVAALKKQIADISGGKIVDVDAGKPFCMDAPTTTYDIVKANGEKVQIAGWNACHNIELQDAEGNANLLKEVLEGLDRLTSLGE